MYVHGPNIRLKGVSKVKIGLEGKTADGIGRWSLGVQGDEYFWGAFIV